MPESGDNFTIELKQTHLNWGKYRHTKSRELTEFEGYIPIPAKYARLYSIYNGSQGEGIGKNLFKCISQDGKLECVLKASGHSGHGSENMKYAKNLSGYKDLKLIGKWYLEMFAVPGDKVYVEWKSNTEMVIELMKSDELY